MTIKEDKTNKLFFTSDLHLFHKNIIDFCDRPFYDVEDMNKTIIQKWNGIIDEDSIIFVLGDMFFTSSIDKITNVMDQLNGEIHLIMGNHDYQNKLDRDVIKTMFASVHDLYEVYVEDPDIGRQGLVLCHYPLLTWNNKMRGYWNLHGHIHSGPKSDATEQGLHLLGHYDVGVDNNSYYPVSYYDVKVNITREYLKNG